MLKEGDMIGPYKLIRRIGKGAFGVVWLAEKKSALATTNVAIKIPADDTIEVEVVQREAAVWVSASGHPNVLPIIDADVYDDHIVIVSEFAPDGSLLDWLGRHQGKAPSIDDAVEIMLGILAGLQHLHSRGIIHRDLKPENILLQGDTPRLADFGIARVLKGTSNTAAASGTPLYMPPEAFDGKRGEHTDIWSAGVIFYQLLTGRLPFEGDGITSIMGAIVNKPPKPIDDCPPYIWDVIEKALAKDPADRFASAAEMRKALRRSTSSASSFENAGDISMHPTLRAAGARTQLGTAPTLLAELPKDTGSSSKNGRSAYGRWLRIALPLLVIIAVAAGGIYFYRTSRGGRQHTDAQIKQLLKQKADAWTATILSAQGQNGGIHEISAGDESAQVWSTAQCLATLLASRPDVTQNTDRIKQGFSFIESSRRTTPSAGWNYYGNSNPFTVTEIAGWVIIAETYAVDRQNLLSEAERQQMVSRIARDLDEVVQRQDKNGGWRPIKEDQPGFIRTWSSAIALWSLIEARRSPPVSQAIGTKYDDSIRRGINWLLLNYKSGQGWVPNPNRPGQPGHFDGLNAQVLFVLSRAETSDAFSYVKLQQAYATAKKEFLADPDLTKKPIDKNNSSVPDIDIRFSGSEFMAEGSTFLWFPWTLAELSELAVDKSLSETDRAAAAAASSDLLDKNYDRLNNYVEEGGLMYIYAENLFCVSVYLNNTAR
ncbi:MAG: protein kinase domain-containing protein [Pyrinomonadaceae bacterium]